MLSCWLTCRSSNANCAVPLVTDSTESDNEFGNDSWASTKDHNTVNNIPEIKRNFMKYLNSWHTTGFRQKDITFSSFSLLFYSFNPRIQMCDIEHVTFNLQVIYHRFTLQYINIKNKIHVHDNMYSPREI